MQKCEISGYCVYGEINNWDDILHTNETINLSAIKAIFTTLHFSNQDIYITSIYRSHSISIPKFIDNLAKYLDDC